MFLRVENEDGSFFYLPEKANPEEIKNIVYNALKEVRENIIRIDLDYGIIKVYLGENGPSRYKLDEIYPLNDLSLNENCYTVLFYKKSRGEGNELILNTTFKLVN